MYWTTCLKVFEQINLNEWTKFQPLENQVNVLRQPVRQLIHKRLSFAVSQILQMATTHWPLYLATRAVLLLKEGIVTISRSGDFFYLLNTLTIYICTFACSIRRCARERYSIVGKRQNLFLTLVKAFPNEFLIDDNWSNIHNDITYVQLHHHTAYIMSTIYMKFLIIIWILCFLSGVEKIAN